MENKASGSSSRVGNRRVDCLQVAAAAAISP